MGRFGSHEDRAQVINWVGSSQFYEMCEFMGWDNEWVEELFQSVRDLPASVSKEITRKCVDMLKKIPEGEV